MSVELPKDAEGREIPLDTSEMFISDGTMVHVVRFEYMYYTCDARGSWFVHINRTSGEHMTLQPCDVHLTQPDSWYKLEEDLRRASERNFFTSYCRYFNTTNRCVNCPIHNDDGCSTHKDERAFGDILDRIRKLRGVD
jgi:hypothetical protein